MYPEFNKEENPEYENSAVPIAVCAVCSAEGHAIEALVFCMYSNNLFCIGFKINFHEL